MGREVKRVPLDFDWPIGVIWKGYINPYNPKECKICEGSGLNKETKLLSDQWYTHLRGDGKEGWRKNLEQDDIQALINADRLWDFTRIPLNDEHKKIIEKKIKEGGDSWLPFNNGYIPSPKEVNEWNKKGSGHDALNQWICVKEKAKRLGIFGYCPICKGKGHYWCDEKYEILFNEFRRIEPSQGDGWQMWENTSEGSPISPVFSTEEELAKWLADNKTSSMGNETATYDEWLAMIKVGYATTGVYDGKTVMSGVKYVKKCKKEE